MPAPAPPLRLSTELWYALGQAAEGLEQEAFTRHAALRGELDATQTRGAR